MSLHGILRRDITYFEGSGVREANAHLMHNWIIPWLMFRAFPANPLEVESDGNGSSILTIMVVQ